MLSFPKIKNENKQVALISYNVKQRNIETNFQVLNYLPLFLLRTSKTIIPLTVIKTIIALTMKSIILVLLELSLFLQIAKQESFLDKTASPWSVSYRLKDGSNILVVQDSLTSSDSFPIMQVSVSVFKSMFSEQICSCLVYS